MSTRKILGINFSQSKGRKPRFKLTISGDLNNGDYEYTVAEYDVEEFKSKILPELVLLYTKCLGAYKMSEFSDNMYDIFYIFNIKIPEDEYGCVHTIKDIILEYIDENGIIYTADLSSMSAEDIAKYLEMAKYYEDVID